jgi:hypothetical protein
MEPIMFRAFVIAVALSVALGCATPAPVAPPAADDIASIPLASVDGTTRTVGEFAGRPVLLDMWATW